MIDWIFWNAYVGCPKKFEDTVNTEAKTSNNMELFFFVLLRTI